MAWERLQNTLGAQMSPIHAATCVERRAAFAAPLERPPRTVRARSARSAGKASFEARRAGGSEPPLGAQHFRPKRAQQASRGAQRRGANDRTSRAKRAPREKNTRAKRIFADFQERKKINRRCRPRSTTFFGQNARERRRASTQNAAIALRIACEARTAGKTTRAKRVFVDFSQKKKTSTGARDGAGPGAQHFLAKTRAARPGARTKTQQSVCASRAKRAPRKNHARSAFSSTFLKKRRKKLNAPESPNRPRSTTFFDQNARSAPRRSHKNAAIGLRIARKARAAKKPRAKRVFVNFSQKKKKKIKCSRVSQQAQEHNIF